MLVPVLCFLLYLPVTASSSVRVVRSSSFCPDVPKKNYTDADFQKGLGEIDSEYELKIILGLKESANLVNEMASIGASQEAVIIAENLVQIAALVPEVSLVSDLMPIEQFKILTSPKSFRASLIQMVDNMCDSFLQADKSMNRVKLNLIAVPSYLGKTIKLLSSDEREARAFMLNIYLERLNYAAEVCATEADTVVTKFRGTIEMLQELHRGCLTCQSNSKMEKTKKEQMKIAYEGEAAAEREYADQIKKDEQEMRERVKKTLKNYDKQVKKMGNLGYLFVAAITDTVSDVLRGFGGKNMFGGFLKKGGKQESAGSIAAAASERQAGNFWNGIVSNLQTQANQTKKEELFTLLQTAVESDIGKLAHMAVNKTKELMSKLEGLSDADGAWKDGVTAAIGELKTVVDQEAATTAQQQQSGGSSGGGGGGGGGITKTLAKGVDALRQQYEIQSRMAEELREKMLQSSLRINALVSKLSTLNLETAELAEIIEYLEKGMVLLNEAKEVWIKMSRFFYSFRHMASDILSNNIKMFTQIADKQVTTGSKLLEDQVMETATHVTAIATAMHFCAETYTETSSRWIMPTIAAVGKNLHLSKEEARAKLSQTKTKATGQLCDVTKFLTARMEQAMDQSKKRTLDFIKEHDKGRA